MPYSEKILDHYNNPRNVGSFDIKDPTVGTGLVGAPECGDVLKLSIKVNPDTGVIEDAKFKTFGCGSACTSASLEPSYVLRALGVGDELAHSSIRFGIGRFNTEEEVDFVIDHVVREVNRLREMSPLYEMVQQGIDLKSIQWAAH